MGYHIMYVHILIFEYMIIYACVCVWIYYIMSICLKNMFIYLLDRSSMIHHAKKYRQIRYAHWWHSNMFFFGGVNPGDITQKMWPHQTGHQ